MTAAGETFAHTVCEAEGAEDVTLSGERTVVRTSLWRVSLPSGEHRRSKPHPSVVKLSGKRTEWTIIRAFYALTPPFFLYPIPLVPAAVLRGTSSGRLSKFFVLSLYACLRAVRAGHKRVWNVLHREAYPLLSGLLLWLRRAGGHVPSSPSAIISVEQFFKIISQLFYSLRISFL